MRILIVEPHKTLLSPQGSRDRLNGLIRLLVENEIFYLVPEGSETTGLPVERVGSFKEPSFFARAIPYFLHLSRDFAKSLRREVDRNSIDLVIFHFPWGLTCRGISSSGVNPRVRKVYFSAGVEADFAAITLSHLCLNFFPLNRIFRWLIFKIERQACKQADLVITMSKLDENRLRILYDISAGKLWTMPHPVECISFSKEDKESARAKLGLPLDALVVLFHGLWNHLPNRQAIESIAEDIAGLSVAKFPQLMFVVAGPGVPADLGPEVRSLGFVENLNELLAVADMAVVPVYSGCGVRMKLFDYFRSGIPVVSTLKGAEGLELDNNRELRLVENSASAVVAGVLELASSTSLRQELASAAQDYLSLGHRFEVIKQDLYERLAG